MPSLPPRRPHTQHGFALMALLALLTAGVLYFLVGQLDAAAMRRQQEEMTTRALAQARDALIGRAAADENRPGSLPCPDTNGDGVAELFAGNHCPTYVGWFPWRTLGISEQRDGTGEPLWYALSPSLRDDDSAQPVNSNSPLTLTFNGATVAAIVLAPGNTLGGQTRPSNAASDYLDGENGDGDFDYLLLPTGIDFNDRALAVSGQDLFAVVEKRVIAEFRGRSNYGLNGYFSAHIDLPLAADSPYASQGTTNSGYIPYPDLDFSTTPWLALNDWLTIVMYTKNSSTQAALMIGSKTYSFTFP